MNAADTRAILHLDQSRLSRLSNNLDKYDFNPRRLNGRKPGGRDWDYAPEEVERFRTLERPRGRRATKKRPGDEPGRLLL